MSGTCTAPLVFGGYCERPATRTDLGIIVARDNTVRTCGAPLCDAAECSQNHVATHGMPEARIEDWRHLARRARGQKRALHGAARGRGTGL